MPESSARTRSSGTPPRPEAGLAHELMQALGAADVGDAKPRHRRAHLQARQLLVQRHRREDGVDPRLDGQCCVTERRVRQRRGLRGDGLLGDTAAASRPIAARTSRGLGRTVCRAMGRTSRRGAQRSTASRRCSGEVLREQLPMLLRELLTMVFPPRKTWQKVLAAAAVVQADRLQDALERVGVGRFVAVGHDRQRVEQVPVGELRREDVEALDAAERASGWSAPLPARDGRRRSTDPGLAVTLDRLFALGRAPG